MRWKNCGTPERTGTHAHSAFFGPIEAALRSPRLAARWSPDTPAAAADLGGMIDDPLRDGVRLAIRVGGNDA